MEYNDKKNKNALLPLIIFSNLFPLYGVIKYNWTIFSVVYVYWLELLIITFFLLLKIIISKDNSYSFIQKLFLAFKLLILRSSIFLFYLLFIVVFLGFMASAKDETGKSYLKVIEILILKDSFFKIALLNFFIFNLINFLFLYIGNGAYKKSKSSDYIIFFDKHLLVVHLVVVLGTFLFKGVTEILHWNNKKAMIACVSLFVIIKIITDIVSPDDSENIQPMQPDKFI